MGASVGPGIRIEDMIPPVGKVNGRGAARAFCPFHGDDNPSAWVNIDQQRFGCNACWSGLYWDVFNVYAMMHGVSNGEAFKAVKG